MANGKHTVSIEKAYHSSKEAILNLFRDNTIFKLTGADDIQSDFAVGGAFQLTFNNRGTISGKFTEITEDKITMEWNVDGFQRPSEIETVAEFTVTQENDMCVLKLTHKNISFLEAAKAKKRAWTEILEDVEQILS